MLAEEWLLLVILCGSACYDVREHRIPNWWILGAVASGMILLLLTAETGTEGKTVIYYLLRITIVIAIMFPIFLLRIIGAGDIKLIAVMAGYLGFASGLQAIVYGCFVGAILALVKMLLHRNLWQRLNYLTAYFRRLFLTKEIVPYYQSERDGRTVTIPFAFCLFVGYVWFLFHN